MNREEFYKLIKDHLEVLYQRALLLLGDAVTANQILQEVLLIVLKRQRECKTSSHLILYLYRLLFFRCKEIIRQRSAAENQTAILIESKVELSNCISLTDKLKVLIEKINLLDEETRGILFLYYFDKLSTADIALLLMTSAHRVRNWVYHGQKKLVRNLLEDGREDQYFVVAQDSKYARERGAPLLTTAAAAAVAAGGNQQAVPSVQLASQSHVASPSHAMSKEERLHEVLMRSFDGIRERLDLDQMKISQFFESLSEEHENVPLSRDEKRLVNQVAWQRFLQFLRKKIIRAFFVMMILAGMIAFAYFFFAKNLLFFGP